MESLPACSCGLLKSAINEAVTPTNDAMARIPIRSDADGKCHLYLTAEQRGEVTACPLCGGHERDSEGRFTAGTPCACGSLAKWTTEPDLPVRYDKRMNEYSMPGLIFTCVICGGRLPWSKRSSFFTKPTDSDVEDFQQRTGHLKTMEEVITLLGPPDFDCAPSLGEDMNYRRQINYANLWDSLDAVFLDMTDGTLQGFCHGKPVQNR